MSKEKNLGGRPPLFKSPEELEELLNKYIKECEEKEVIPCIAGCAYSIGMDRQTFYNYEQKDLFFGIIKRFRDYVEFKMEESLVNDGTATAGKIFISKNYGYTDKQELNLTVKEYDIDIVDDED